MSLKKILVWFRNDLRLHDNEMLVEAIAKSDSILPVYFFDPRYFETTIYHTSKTGFNRTKFILESVINLKKQFSALGGDLMIVHGKPEDHIPSIVEEYGISEVYHHREVAPEETAISAFVEDMLWKQKINLKHFIGHTLYNKEDLPFPIKDIPDVFTQFKKKAERDAIVKSCFDSPDHISFVEVNDWGSVPQGSELGFDNEGKVDVTENAILCGGEDAGLAHLKSLLEEGSEVYQTNGKANKTGFSSKLSPWLALGCLSPRMVYWLVKEAEGRFGVNANFNHIILGLLVRDHYRFMFKKHGLKYVGDADFSNVHDALAADKCGFKLWREGATGNRIVDDLMAELNSTGFINYSSRLLVATYLVHVAKVHWTNGAAYFQEKLIDFAPASNWGNWATVAGTSIDTKSKWAYDLDKNLKALDIDSTDIAQLTP